MPGKKKCLVLSWEELFVLKQSFELTTEMSALNFYAICRYACLLFASAAALSICNISIVRQFKA